MALPGRVLALTLWPQSEFFEFVVRALEMPLALLWTGLGPGPKTSRWSFPLWRTCGIALENLVICPPISILGTCTPTPPASHPADTGDGVCPWSVPLPKHARSATTNRFW